MGETHIADRSRMTPPSTGARTNRNRLAGWNPRLTGRPTRCRRAKPAGPSFGLKKLSANDWSESSLPHWLRCGWGLRVVIRK